jgi:acetyl esterase/lipase
MRNVRLLLVAALAASLLAFVTPEGADAAPGLRYRDEVFSKTFVSRQDVAYGAAYDHAGHRQVLRLDVHEPAGDRAPVRAAVVWIHGGYFQGGDKSDYGGIIDSLTRAGYVTVSINYRLNPNTPPDLSVIALEGRADEYIDTVRDAQHDAQAAIRWVRAHADELRVDPDKVAVAGHSAGGITTNMVAFNDEDPGTSGNPGYSSRPTAAVVLSGGVMPIKEADVDQGEPPILFLHGAADTIVPIFSAPPTCLVTIALLNVCELAIDPDQDHHTFGLPQVRDFLYRYVATSPPFRTPVNVTPVGLESLTDPASLQHNVENIVDLLEGVAAF